MKKKIPVVSAIAALLIVVAATLAWRHFIPGTPVAAPDPLAGTDEDYGQRTFKSRYGSVPLRSPEGQNWGGASAVTYVLRDGVHCRLGSQQPELPPEEANSPPPLDDEPQPRSPWAAIRCWTDAGEAWFTEWDAGFEWVASALSEDKKELVGLLDSAVEGRFWDVPVFASVDQGRSWELRGYLRKPRFSDEIRNLELRSDRWQVTLGQDEGDVYGMISRDQGRTWTTNPN